jgi:hypothetical protein
MAAYYPSATDEQLLAAEILALRDWLVPEEAPCPEMATPLRDQRQDLRAILTKEADRAERGE